MIGPSDTTRFPPEDQPAARPTHRLSPAPAIASPLLRRQSCCVLLEITTFRSASCSVSVVFPLRSTRSFEKIMASCAATMTGVAASSLSLKRTQAVRAAAPQVSFSGLRRGTKVDSIAMNRSTSFASQTAIAKSCGKVTCEANASLIITLSTGALLALGRFVFLPFQRDNVSRQGLPEQNGVTHYEAGDSRAQEVVSVLKTNDPAGFTLVDVLAWGALGHAIGFFVLATLNNGYDPQF